MADENKNTDAGTDNDLDLGGEKSSGKKKLIVIIVAVFLAINAAIGAYFFLFSGSDVPEGEEVVEEVSDEELGPTFYHAFDPEMVVNLEGRPSMLQVGLQARVRGEETIEFLKHNDPMIRHQFLSLLSAQDGKQLQKRANKEKLQQALLTELRRIVTELGGPDPERSIEAIYFVSFVMQ